MKLKQNKTSVNEKILRDAKSIRLFYVAMERFMRYSTYSMCVGHTYGASTPFILPESMTLEEACKVVSYLTDKIEAENNLLPCSEKAVAMVSKELENYGFKRVNEELFEHNHVVSAYEPLRRIRTILPVCQSYSGVVDLFTVSGDVRVFEHSDLSSRYFDWYTPKVHKQEIDDIYKKIQNKETNLGEESEVC